MAKPLFIIIAVHRAATLDVLDGVLQSAAEIGTWADANGYDKVVITDDPAQPPAQRAVTVDRIKAALPSSVLLDRPRIAVYFCGHGLYAPGDQHWVLSAGPDQRRISAAGFRDALETYGTAQVAIISDACSTPWVDNATSDNVVDNYPGEITGAYKDKFYSTRAGGSSYTVPAKSGQPAFCVFSKALLEVLNAPQPREEYLDAAYLLSGQLVLSSQSLAHFLNTSVPLRAPGGNSKQSPRCEGAFVPVDNVYRRWAPGSAVIHDGGAPLSPPGSARQPPPVIDMRSVSLRFDNMTRELMHERQAQSRSEWRGPLMADASKVLERWQRPYGEIRIFVDSGPVESKDVDIVAAGGENPLANTLASPRESLFAFGARPSWPMLARVGDLFAPFVIFKDLWAVLAFRRRPNMPMPDEDAPHGLELLNWRPFYKNAAITYTDTVEALKGLTLGILSAEDVWRLATPLRWDKHANPMLGIVAAYLYNNVGDIDAIRRMAAFYDAHSQDLPFDIALLARVPLKTTDAGFWADVPGVAALAKGK